MIHYIIIACTLLLFGTEITASQGGHHPAEFLAPNTQLHTLCDDEYDCAGCSECPRSCIEGSATTLVVLLSSVLCLPISTTQPNLNE